MLSEEWARPLVQGANALNNDGEIMKLEEMERALANYDEMIRILKNQMKEGTNPKATPDVIAQLQQWRDDLDVQIGLERIKQGTRCRPARPSEHS